MYKHVSSFERFLSEYKWSMYGVIASLVSLLLSHLCERFMVHGAFLTAEYGLQFRSSVFCNAILLQEFVKKS
jgi:hypothetical protein